MPFSKFTFIIATVAFILVAGVISYASFNNQAAPLSVISVAADPTPTDISTPTPTSVSVPAPTSTPQPRIAAPTVDNRCIIVVDGQKYDVTVFRNQHSGGNIFSCGTDMSTIFHQQHNQRYLQMMAPYRI